MTAPKRPAPTRGPKPAPRKAGSAKAAKSVRHPAPKAAAKPAAKAASKPAAAGKPPVGKPPAGKPAIGKPVAKAAPAKAAPAVEPRKPAPEPKPPVEKTPPRAQLLPKLHRALKANYKLPPPPAARPILEQVMLACCLENAPLDVAERALARLLETYVDLNEVRVTTVAELAETLHDLPDPSRAALSLRRALQSVFESSYNFTLEHARKHSIAHGIKVLEGLHGVPQFVVQHVASTVLGGHFVPLDRGALGGLWLCGAITRHEYDTGKVAGIERVIPKKAGPEFSGLLHLFGIDVLTNLHGTTVRKVVTAVNPSAKDRFPKRGEPLPEPVPPPVTDREGLKAADAARAAAEVHRPAGPQAAARPAGKTPMPPPGSGPKKPGDGKGKSGPKPFVVKPLSLKPPAEPPPPPPAAKPAPKSAAKAPAPAKHSTELKKQKPR